MASYSTRADSEAYYGAVELAKWADKDNDGDATAIADAIAAAGQRTYDEINMLVRGGPYTVPFAEPYPPEIVDISQMLVGARLYAGRGAQDLDAATGFPQDRLASIRERCYRLLEEIKAGSLQLEISGVVTAPVNAPFVEYVTTLKDGDY